MGAWAWEALADDKPYDSPFGQLLEQATVTLQVYDEVNPQGGKKILLRDKGKKVPEDKAEIV